MAKPKTEKLNFSKFFPDSTSFVSVTGTAASPENFNVSVKIGDGSESISIYASDWYKDDALSTLKAIQEGVQKAIEFHQKALKLPKLEVPEIWETWNTAAKKVTPAVIKPKKKVTARK